MILPRLIAVPAMWFALCLATFASLATPAATQTVPVRSGAHDGFDRLVLDMPERMPWRTLARDDGASLVFDGAVLRFDLGAVFRRIGRQRLRAISAPEGGGRLELEFACACRIETFWLGTDMLVIDISDAPRTDSVSPARPRPLTLPLTDHLAGTEPAPALTSTAGAGLAERLERIGPRLTALPDARPAAPSPDDGLGDMRAALQRQLGRAASQGLVTPVPDQRHSATPEPPPPATAAEPTAPSADRNGPEMQAGRPVAPPGMRVTTSMTRDVTGPALRDHASDACPDVSHIDVASWGGTRPFAVEAGRLNSVLFGEFDAVQDADALRLARLYIHHGFGVEARQILGWLDAGLPEIALAGELAELVETLSLPVDAQLAGALRCDEPGVLWAVLASPDLSEESVFDHRALRRSFVALPEGLRRALGPGLVQRLVAVGHHRTADAVLRHLRDGDVLSDAETGLARAALADGTGKGDAAERALREITGTNTMEAGVALAETIERALAREAPVAFDDAQLAGALAFEHRGTPLGGRLALAYLSALAASGAFDEAMTEFERLRSSVADAEAARVASVLATYLVRRADDVTFLRAMITDRVAPPGALDGALSADVAQRLVALGFPTQATRHVAPREAGEEPEAGAESVAHRLLRARIALAQDRPGTAARELLGLTGSAADLLRAEALAARGDHADARQLFAAHGAARLADRSALHLGHATEMARAEDPRIRELGEVIASDTAAPVADEPAGLAADRALLERSTALRGAMERLLAATQTRVASE